MGTHYRRWFRTLFHPLSHLVGTVVVNVNVVACWIVATLHPDRQPELVLLAVAPLIVWYVVMAVRMEHADRGGPDQ